MGSHLSPKGDVSRWTIEFIFPPPISTFHPRSGCAGHATGCNIVIIHVGRGVKVRRAEDDWLSNDVPLLPKRPFAKNPARTRNATGPLREECRRLVELTIAARSTSLVLFYIRSRFRFHSTVALQNRGEGRILFARMRFAAAAPTTRW